MQAIVVHLLGDGHNGIARNALWYTLRTDVACGGELCPPRPCGDPAFPNPSKFERSVRFFIQIVE